MARTIEDIEHLELENLSDEQLRTLQSRVREIINQRVQSRIDEFRLMAREAGFEMTLSKIGEGQGRRGRPRIERQSSQDQRRGPLPPLYRNPENPAETWSGRGIPPRWLREQMEKTGKPKEDFLIVRQESREPAA
ncbi:MAG: H-NS histone family protein [Acidobacteria bacterium]|nr:H-NS histone family protein [Acidobacteriota bacterium]